MFEVKNSRGKFPLIRIAIVVVGAVLFFSYAPYIVSSIIAH